MNKCNFHKKNSILFFGKSTTYEIFEKYHSLNFVPNCIMFLLKFTLEYQAVLLCDFRRLFTDNNTKLYFTISSRIFFRKITFSYTIKNARVVIENNTKLYMTLLVTFVILAQEKI